MTPFFKVVAYAFLLPGCRAATSMSVGTCAELQQAAVGTATDDIVAELTAEDITCDSWTTFEITTNRLKIVMGEGLADTGRSSFHNVRFMVSSTLRIDFWASFSGDKPEDDESVSQQVNGGILNVAEGGRARFMSHVVVEEITISSGTNSPSAISPDAGHGGCFYNKGLIRFESSLDAFECKTTGSGELGGGDGGALWNGETGKVVIKSHLSMEACGQSTDGSIRGGAIYNAGKVNVYEDASFPASFAMDGGAIFNAGEFKFLKKAHPTFQNNYAGNNGAQVYNSGTMLFKYGATFNIGVSGGSGGAIYNTGSVSILSGDDSDGPSVVFDTNGAVDAGGAIANIIGATYEIPDDTLFEFNYLLYDSEACDNIYVETTDGFVCLP